MDGTAVTWMSVTDAAVADGDGDGPAGISEADGAADGADDNDGAGDSGAEVAGARASGKHALAITPSAAVITTEAAARRIGRL
jgi:hypothetical protein